MKFFSILSHPYTLIVCYLLILISGEHWGGFYLLYILLALPFGGIHALLAVGGIVAILVSYHRLRRRRMAAQMVNLIGVLSMAASLYFFFHNDWQHYNRGTFEQTVPILTFVATAVIATCFLLRGFLPKASGKRVQAI